MHVKNPESAVTAKMLHLSRNANGINNDRWSRGMLLGSPPDSRMHPPTRSFVIELLSELL